ncbi:hypothetical protein [Bacillus sp. FJAT-27245]|uniref:hypothetical protein n=1 Tax=Bacillus sp. FJAT-27245 TaxID=1684144 RepID=UPI000A651785|nr:hypothetical protein [Bacillus sp. FJAT-27245]
MPRGKELEQLPMGKTAPGAGKDLGVFKRDTLKSFNRTTQPKPSLIREGTDTDA